MGSSIGCLNLAIFIFMRLDWGNLPLRLRNMVPVVFVAESTLGPVKANFLNIVGTGIKERQQPVSFQFNFLLCSSGDFKGDPEWTVL